MSRYRANYKIGTAVIVVICLATLWGCSGTTNSSKRQDPRGMEWGSVSELPVIRDACLTLDDGAYELPAIYKPELMTFMSPVYLKGYNKRSNQWTVEVSIPRTDLPDKEATCRVLVERGDRVRSVEIIEK